MIEYEVVWNGAHRGCDADLLQPDARQVEKHHGQTVARVDYTDHVLRVLAGGVWLTMTDLCRQTGLDSHHVNNVLYRLTLQGRIERQDTSGTSPFRRHESFIQVYRLIS